MHHESSSVYPRMAKHTVLLVCLLITVMDVVAGILGIEAEIAQNKVKHLKLWVFECRDPSYQAFKLGLAAAILLLLCHAIANLLGGWICICTQEDFDKANPNKQTAVASLIFSWIILAIAFSMLIIGALANSRTRKSCGLSNHRILSIGGILCFIHGLFTIFYYISTTSTTKHQKTNHHNPPA